MEPTELEMIETQYWVDKAEALARLESNADFKSLIMEGYFKDRAIDGVSMLANDYVKKQGKRPDVMEFLVAISQLQDYFKMVKNLGAVAQDDMDEENSPVAE